VLVEGRLPAIDAGLQGTYQLLRPLVEQETRLTGTLRLCNRLRELSTLAAGEERGDGAASVIVGEENVAMLLERLSNLIRGLDFVCREASFCLRTLDALGSAADRLTGSLLAAFRECLEANNVVPEEDSHHAPIDTDIVPMGGLLARAIASQRHLFPIASTSATGNAQDARNVTSPTMEGGADRVQAAFVEIRGRALADAVKSRLAAIGQDPAAQLAPILALVQRTLRPAEAALGRQLFGDDAEAASVIVDQVMRPLETLLLDAVDRQCRAWSSAALLGTASSTDFASALTVLAVLDDIARRLFSGAKEQPEGVPQMLPMPEDRGLTLQVCRKLAVVGRRLLGDFAAWLERDARAAEDAVDWARATVLESTSLVCTVLNVLGERERVAECLLLLPPPSSAKNNDGLGDFGEAYGATAVGCFAVGSYAQDILAKGRTAIEAAASSAALYRRSAALGILFRLSNYQHLLRNVPAHLAGYDFSKSTEALVGHQSGVLVDSWARLAQLLATDKLAAKERFRAFHGSLEDMLRQQTPVLMPDGDLRRRLRDAILQAVLPPFEAFHRTNAALCKLLTPDALRSQLQSLFSG
jgi:hypothetical protein